jgi:hypothetical protein
LIRLFKNLKGNDKDFFEFILSIFEKRIKESELKISKLQGVLKKILSKSGNKVSYYTRMKILASTRTSQAVLVTDLVSGISSTYPSARRAALALNVSNSTIMNKLNNKNTRTCKGKYLIKRLGSK